MTRRKSQISRPYRPERVSRETMAYLLDMSTDTFDRLVATGKLPAAAERGGIKRWNPEEVFVSFDSGDIPKPANQSGIDAECEQESDADPLMANIGAFRGKAKADRSRGAA